MDDLAHGVQVTVIDLGLSRMDAGDGSDGDRVHWTPFDEEIFMGEGWSFSCSIRTDRQLTCTVGDYQYDVYRMMRDLTREEWEGYHPMTNVMVRKIFCRLLDH
jgi:serine/threonine-protein kinase haspin